VAGLIFQRARTEEKKRNVRRRSWKPRARQPWTQVAPVTLSGIAKSRRFPNSAMRRYFNSHEVLLAEGSTRWSNRVCASLREPGATSPSRVTEKLANGPVAGTPFCGLLRQPPPASRERGGSRQGCPDQVDQRLPICRSRMRFGQELPVLGRSRTKPSCGLLIGGLIKHQPVDT
jgi:hypothetical protein